MVQGLRFVFFAALELLDYFLAFDFQCAAGKELLSVNCYRGVLTLNGGTGGRSLSSRLGVVLAVVPGESPTRGLLLTLGVAGTSSGLLLTLGVLGLPTLPTFGVLPELRLPPHPRFIIFPNICTSSAASSNISSSIPSCALYTSLIVCCAKRRLPSPSWRQS